MINEIANNLKLKVDDNQEKIKEIRTLYACHHGLMTVTGCP